MLIRIETEYREMPGLKLTERQMQRLWDLDRETCVAVVRALIARHVVVKTTDHLYVRPDVASRRMILRFAA